MGGVLQWVAVVVEFIGLSLIAIRGGPVSLDTYPRLLSGLAADFPGSRGGIGLYEARAPE